VSDGFSILILSPGTVAFVRNSLERGAMLLLVEVLQEYEWMPVMHDSLYLLSGPLISRVAEDETCVLARVALVISALQNRSVIHGVPWCTSYSVGCTLSSVSLPWKCFGSLERGFLHEREVWVQDPYLCLLLTVGESGIPVCWRGWHILLWFVVECS